MDADRMGFLARLWLGLALLFRVLFDSQLASSAKKMLVQPAPPQAGAPPVPSGPAATKEIYPAQAPAAKTEAKPGAPDPTAALQLLSILQREGRFIDFLQESIATFSDAEIGAAARVVHEGCKRGLGDYVSMVPVRPEAEGDSVMLDRGFDASRLRITGNVVGEPPFRGRLAHHGWLVTQIDLPALTAGHDPKVLTPAEVEL